MLFSLLGVSFILSGGVLLLHHLLVRSQEVRLLPLLIGSKLEISDVSLHLIQEVPMVHIFIMRDLSACWLFKIETSSVYLVHSFSDRIMASLNRSDLVNQ
jgi:hypothetical protein